MNTTRTFKKFKRFSPYKLSDFLSNSTRKNKTTRKRRDTRRYGKKLEKNLGNKLGNKEFIFFGCWNKGLCNYNTSSPENGMSKVFKKLHELKESPGFYIIAGDNYYPPKKELEDYSYKYLNKEELESGFNCLKELNKPIHVLVGNHDVEQIREFEKIPKVNCIITDLQVQFMNKHNSFNYKHIYKKVGKTLIVFLNTTYLTEDWIKFTKCNKLLSQYKSSGGGNGGGDKDNNNIYYKTLLDDEFTKYSKELSKFKDKIDNIILTGHDPLWGPKYKKKKQKDKFTPLLESGIHFIYDLYNIFPNANKYYLCADTHLWHGGSDIIIERSNMDSHYYNTNMYRAPQRSKPNKLHIKQYIVGTGGADLDDCPKKYSNTHTYNKSSKNSTKIIFKSDESKCHSTYGYLKVSLDKKTPSFNFIKV